MTFGATILDATGLRLTKDEIAFFRDVNPFGFIVFARNLDTPDQIRALCDDFRNAVGRDALITIDQEGGRVQRLRPPLARDWPAPLDFVSGLSNPEDAETAMRLRYRLIAHELRSYGIDSNCAPMVDVVGPNTHDFLKNRCYGTSPDVVAGLGRAVADGLLAGGVLPVLKHVPGHGAADADSHFDLPRVSDAPDLLAARDFAPFKALNDLPLGMTAHLVFDAIDPVPATLSAKMIALIRTQIGFDGLIMTDDISMKALKGDLATLSREAIAAGCDVILHCNGSIEERQQVAQAAGQMGAAAQIRAEAAMTWRRDPEPLDIKGAEAKLTAIMAGQGDG
ncbi:MAG: beta-N-acetylhexosaminidase [Sedimentitalea sp.]